MTGIDRVELAYLDGLLARDVRLFGLVRSVVGFLWLDRAGLQNVRAQLAQERPWGDTDLIGMLVRRINKDRRKAEAGLRRHAKARCIRPGLSQMLRRVMPEGTVYLNVGHSNLGDRTLSAVRKVKGAQVAVMVHDTIPLDWPATQRPGTAEAFARKLATAARHAHAVICSAESTAKSVANHIAKFGGAPRIITAPLGVDLAKPDAKALLQHAKPVAPYFVCTGTIDTRKNQSWLLDVWEELARHGTPPQLYLAGTRGWGDTTLFKRLDTLPEGGPVKELPGLSDAALAALVESSAGLLHPSLAEGFGLPVYEAALRDLPVICAPLAIYRELLADIPVYAAPGDMYQWTNAIENILNFGTNNRHTGTEGPDRHPNHPTWTSHLNLVLSTI